jgi:protein-ribulosamine 3-kinase
MSVELTEKLVLEAFAENNMPISQIDSMSAVGGGCIHNAVLLQTNKGPFFLKWNKGPYAFSQLLHEKIGLDYLSEKKVIRTPEVHFLYKVDELALLLLEYIAEGNPATSDWRDFGMSMAELHKHSLDKFGFKENNFIGSLHQTNEYQDSWADFFIYQRIEPMLKMADQSGFIDASLKKSFSNFYKSVNEIFPEENPALIHGDLWSGNFLFNKNGIPYIFDPAVYYGHREIELSFMKLFGGFSPEFFRSYNEVFPLKKGFEDRVQYYNLYPLLVHVNLFGSSYLQGIKRALSKF